MAEIPVFQGIAVAAWLFPLGRLGCRGIRGFAMRFIVYLAAAMFAVAAPASAVEWINQTNDALGFSASFPVAPKSEVSVEQGVKLTTISAFVPEVMCLVVIGDYPSIPNVEEELKASRDNFVKGIDATLISDRFMRFPRGSTELSAVAFDAKSATHHFDSIIVIDKLRVYEVLAGVPLDGGSKELSDRCVSSFKLTP